MIEQWGDMKMSVHYSNITSSWVWSCIFGCQGIDHEGEQEAREAFLAHDCHGMKA